MADAVSFGDGSALQPLPPVGDGSLSIRGGVGGISFQLEELSRGADQLDEVAQQLLEIEAEARKVHDELEMFAQNAVVSGYPAVNAVGEARSDVGKVREQLVGISAQVRSSRRAYEDVEARNALPHVLRPDQIRWSGAPGVLAAGRDVTQETYNRLIATGYRVGDVLHELLKSPLLEGMQPRPVTIEKMDESVEEFRPTMAGSLRRLEKLHALNDGEIEVIQLGNRGSASWMVLIPGTQLEPSSSNPFDAAGVGEALGYGSQEVIPAIGQALKAAGAAAGDPVVAVGHSQGGIHAMNLAQDKAFLSEFNLKFVLTAGSPVGGITSEPGISALHLEHIQDWVPGTDGADNPDTKDRVTVTLTNPVATPKGQDPGLGPGHDQENYAAGAELVSASHDPSLLASSAAFAGAVGGGGAVKVTHFKLKRQPMPQRKDILPPKDLPETRSVAGAR
ncbi:hypothetical protein [Arthrobacter sp. fls2-241-R2A-200]|uniref:hypothetical protein n=1 Tax=unclassified Arthrobacter TaxID=235627 RepID=UPI0025514BB4|nr:hypothetical protein [Arthrobacter sp. fls2-241-R2A-200]